MIKFESLRQSVYTSLFKQTFEGTESEKKINKIIAGCLLLNTAKVLLASKESYQDGVSTLLDSYAGTYKNIAEDLSKKYVSYKYMKAEIESWKVDNFLKVGQNQINKIVDIYNKKKERELFSCNSFSQTMYNVMNLQYNQNKRLSSIHFNIIVPLVTYYKELYGIRDTDVTVEDRSEGNIAGKVIYISINGVELRKILSDIENDTLNIGKYIYSSAITVDGFVKLILR